MLGNIKALVAVLTIATIVMALGWKVAIGFIPESDLRRRVACWYTLTVLGFLSPSFWLYVLVAAPLVAWAARRDSNPLGVYAMLLFVIPPLQIQIPTAGLLNLFYVDNARLLAFVILVPVAVRAIRSPSGPGAVRASAVETFIWLFGALQIVQLFPYESVTNTMRRSILFLLDVYLVYFAFSRGAVSKPKIDDTFASFCFAGAVLAMLSAFESLKQWLLYTQIGDVWGATNVFAWLFRGDHLRAQASTGHALSLGYMLAIALGMWMYLKADVSDWSTRLAVAMLLCVGIYFTYSRGPMLTAAILVLTYVGLSQPNLKRSIASVATVVAATAVFLWSPLGSGVTEGLPFIGTQEQENVVYRQQLAIVSWELIQHNPWFGDPFALLNMEALRQGQGIIDLVNAFASVALFNGFVGLALFVGAFAAGIKGAYARYRNAGDAADSVATWRLGAVLISAMVATLVFMGTAGNAWLQWQLLGMLVAYASLPVTQPTRRSSGEVRITEFAGQQSSAPT